MVTYNNTVSGLAIGINKYIMYIVRFGRGREGSFVKTKEQN